jgi:acetyltransferase-like isoleucine patch superfamily enzyme
MGILNIFKRKNMHSNINISDFGKNNIIDIDPNIKFATASNIYIGSDANNCQIIIKETDCENLNIQIRILHGDYQKIRIDKNFSSWLQTIIYSWEPYNNLYIGENCMSGGCKILCGDSHEIRSIKTNDIINYNKGINIGNHCWIGSDATILKNVNLTNDVIVATKSVVTKSVDIPFCAIAGNPAKIIKKDVAWSNKVISEAEKKMFLEKLGDSILCKQ